MRIAHLSDTHFGTEVPAVEHALINFLYVLKPDLIIVSGDVTQRARTAEFNAARAFLGCLPNVPKLLVPGNHDLPLFNLPLRLFAPRHAYHRAFGPADIVWSADRTAVVGIDSTLRFRHTRGGMALPALHRRVSGIGATVTVIVAHHPLHTLLDQDRHECLIGAAETAAELACLSADLVLSGHVHMPLLADTRASFPKLHRHFVLSGAGTAVSSRIRSGAPNSFNLIDIDPATPAIRLVRHDCDKTASGFTPVAMADFSFAEDGWRRIRA